MWVTVCGYVTGCVMVRFRTMLLMRYGGALRCVTVRYFDALRTYGVLRWCVTTVRYAAALHRCVTAVHYGVLQHYVTTVHDSSALQYYVTVVQYADTLLCMCVRACVCACHRRNSTT